MKHDRIQTSTLAIQVSHFRKSLSSVNIQMYLAFDLR